MWNDEQDVIVIGAGLAGLTASRKLRKAGHRVLVLEGRDRIGGRAFTGEFAGMDVELMSSGCRGCESAAAVRPADAGRCRRARSRRRRRGR
jgi:monoamine oxidase